ncbi:MAG: rRNA maturation RNase YbeY [Planctomycetota bacterium]|jgi:rRNA maturation RNase YbeY
MKVTDTTTQRTALSTDDGDGSAADTDTPPEPAEPPASAAKRAPDALAERLEVQRLPGDNPHNLSVNERWLHDRLVSALAHVARPVERITVTIVGDEKMRALNQTHRAVSDTTDVLSFERRGNDDAIEADIVICADEAARRAAELDHSLEQELLLYALHGVLHCAGFDDQTNEDFEAMHVEEDRILTAIGVGPTFARDSSGHDDRRQPKIVTEGPAVD